MVLSAPSAGRGDQHALGAGGQVGRGLVLGGEDAGAFERDVDAQILRAAASPGSRSAVTLILPRPTSIESPSTVDGAGEAAVDAVVAQQVGVGLDRAQVVDRHHLDVAAAVLDDRAQDEAADAAETVDGDANGHVSSPYDRSMTGSITPSLPAQRAIRACEGFLGADARFSRAVLDHMRDYVVLFFGKLNSQVTRFSTALTAASAVMPKCL